MINVVVIEANGTVKTQSLKKCLFSDLYKKCGFRNDNHLAKRITWKLQHKSKQLCVSVFAKNNGRANNENKFDFPPPIDNELYLGKIIIIACKGTHAEENVVDFDDNAWAKIYERLMGGFIDLDNTSGEEEPEEEIPEHLKTKHGYKRDGFVVDDETDEDDDDDEDDDEDDDDEDDEDNDDSDDDDGEDEDEDDGEEEDGEDDDDIAIDDDVENDIINGQDEPVIFVKTEKRKQTSKKQKRTDIKTMNDDELFSYDGELQEEAYLSD